MSIDLLLEHFLLNSAALVNQLLLSFNGCAVVVEFGVFLAQGVILCLELGVLTASDLIGAFLLALGLQSLKAFEHLLTNLLGSLHVIIEFLFIDAVFGGKELCEASLTLLEIGSFTAAHISNSVANDVLLDQFVCLGLPVRLVCQISIATNLTVDLLEFLQK